MYNSLPEPYASQQGLHRECSQTQGLWGEVLREAQSHHGWQKQGLKTTLKAKPPVSMINVKHSSFSSLISINPYTNNNFKKFI